MRSFPSLAFGWRLLLGEMEILYTDLLRFRVFFPLDETASPSSEEDGDAGGLSSETCELKRKETRLRTRVKLGITENESSVDRNSGATFSTNQRQKPKSLVIGSYAFFRT